jgi:hypothetical protein
VTTAYATTDELAAFLAEGVVVTDAARQLERASEVLDSFVTAAFTVDTDTGLPTDETIAGILRDACCLQIEYWLEVGEDHDTAGLAGASVSIGQLNIDRLPPVLGPRARRLLNINGLFNANTSGWPALEFFAPSGVPSS